MTTYKIRRFYAPHMGKAAEDVEGLSGLTLEEAQEHCDDPSTSTSEYFDGYMEENPSEESIRRRRERDLSLLDAIRRIS